MSTEQLKQILLNENLKDKRKTVSLYTILYVLGLILIIFPIGLFYLISIEAAKFEFLDAFNLFPAIVGFYEEFSLLLNTLLFSLILGALVYLLRQIKRKTQPKKEIDRLIDCLESGAKSHTLEEKTRYKLDFSFFKKKIKLLPVQILYVIMNNDNRPFNLPVPKEKMNSIKLCLETV